MSSKTARKYLNAQSLPETLKAPRDYRTRSDAFALHWDEISQMLTQAPELEAKTLLYHLMERYPSHYQSRHLRTLQRRLQQYPAKGHKYYLQLLQYAKLYGESQVEAALQLCQESYQLPMPELIKAWLINPKSNVVNVNILQPVLADYDQLLATNQSGGVLC